MVYNLTNMNDGSHLKQLRLNAGLTVRELAKQLDVHHTNIVYWERTGRIANSKVLPKMAKLLGVSVEELLGQPKPKRNGLPGGKLGTVVERISRMPRRRQQRVIETIETLLAGEEATT